MAKAKNPFSYLQRRLLKQRALVANNAPINHEREEVDDIEELDVRLKKMLSILNNDSRPAGNMIFFVMYDIASNKVRRSVAKYLIEKGCHRVQHSIFLADLPNQVMHEIENDLQKVQEMYDNDDSIFVAPIPIDQMRGMKVIGKELDYDLILKTKSTLFF